MPETRSTIGILTVALILSAAVPTAAQVPSRSLGEPDATFPEAFSLVMGLRELPDGRILVADPLGQALVVADLEAGSADTLGEVGQGPGEYRQPDGIFPLPGGSSLLTDLGNTRLTEIGPDLELGESMPMTQSREGMGRLGMLVIMPQATDDQGRVYFQPLMSGGRGGRFPDSAAIVRYDMGSSSLDTVAQIKLPEVKVTRSGSGNDQSVSARQVPLSPRDSWAVAPDGRVALVRASDYHVEWVGPDGSVIAGRPVDYEPVSIRTADKEEWAEAGANGLGVSISIDDGQRQMSFSRGAGGRSLDGLEFPETKPPFVDGGVWVTQDGDVWVQRSVPAGAAPVIDVFGADANIKAQIVLPTGRQIVGFGRGTVYLVATDEFGLQWLERYRTS